MRRTLCTALLLLCTTPTHAQETANTSLADKTALRTTYYQRCLEADPDELSRSARESYCTCSADKAAALLTPAQLQTLGGTSGGAAIQYATLAQIQGPCLAVPVRELENSKCLAAPQKAESAPALNQLQQLCGCVADGVSRFVAQNGGELMANAYEGQRWLRGRKPTLVVQNTVGYRLDVNRQRATCTQKVSGAK